MVAGEGGLRGAADWFVRLGVPLAVFAVVLAVFLGERMSIDHELQLVAPSRAVPGTTIPLRTLLFDALEEPDGPRLVSSPASVRLVSADGAVVATSELRASEAGGAEGSLAIPLDATGPLALEAIARIDGAAVASARGRLDLGPEAPEAPQLGRLAGALQQLAPGPVEAIGAHEPPSRLDVRVVGGVCVPEQPCEILVHVGEPAASVRIAGPALSDVEPADVSTAGIARLRFVAHGSEARATLTALRDGEPVARREMQLPIALATPALRVERRVLEEGSAIELEVSALGDRPAVIVDAYRDGRWIATGSVPLSGEPFAAPLDSLAPGVVCLQVRTDPFSAERAAVAWIAVGRSGEEPDAVVDRALGTLGQSGGDPSAPPAEAQTRFAWASASLEWSVRVLPEAISGYAEDVARVQARREQLRIAALVGLALGLVVLVVVFLKRGVGSALEANRIMDATGDPELASARHRRRTLLSALAIVATVLLAFLAAAALIVARAHLLP